MKEQFRHEKISASKGAYIDTINSILEEYASAGYRLTLRQLYYQLVARDHIPNLVREYSKLSRVLVDARMNGLTDWDYIEDRIRQPYIPFWTRGIKEAVQTIIDAYRLDRQEGQDEHIEVWTEKDAVSNILKRVTTRYHVQLMVNRGYSSCSAMKDAFDRMKWRWIDKDQPTVILYVGDHDPSGLDMVRDIKDRLHEFGLSDFKVEHVALTMDQIEQFSPPPNPAKITDPRSGWYISEHGDESWELDALRPEDLERIVKEAVEAHVDEMAFYKVIDRENEDKLKLEEFIEGIEDV